MRLRSTSFQLALVTAIALTGGCGVPPATPSPDLLRPPTAFLTLGGANATDGKFEPLTPGQDAVLVPGAQGGFHVWMKYRVTGLAPGRYHAIRVAHRVSDGRGVLRLQPDVAYIGAPVEGSSYWEYPDPLPMFMCPSPIGISIVDQQILFEIDVLADDLTTTLASGTVVLVPRCPTTPTDTNVFCMKICTG